jgi:uncharacterized heparinase superfamily protein
MVDRYVDALRHMRTSQLLARARRLVPPAWLAAGPRTAATGFTAAARGAGVDTAPQSGPQPPPELDGRFRAVGHVREFGAPGFWTDEADGLLFLFHLHGFTDLARYCAQPVTAAGDAFWATVIESWLSECGRPSRTAWHPYPLSGRVIAWSAALSRRGWDSELTAAMRASLSRQLTLLRRSVEQDIGGNHVLRNATAMIIGGICTCDARTEEAGLALLERELDRQILRDGGHEERSTSYQRAILADLEDVAATLRRASREVPGWLTAASTVMEGWLRALTGPDGRLPLLNDAWEGPPLDPVRGETLTDLASSGYVVVRSGGDQAVLDVGLVAPPHLPPHAHADVLSFVLWADGERIVVDPGAFTYSGPERGRFRGSVAHSTVEVDGRDQCDLWGPFRAAHMPNVRRGAVQQIGDAIVLTAEHDGFRRLPDPVVHRRTFCWLPGDGLVVVDRLLARTTHRASTRIPLAPGLATDGQNAGPLRIQALGAGRPPVVEAGAYAPFLGQKVPASVIRRDLYVEPGMLFGWALVRPGTVATLTDDGVSIQRPGREPVQLVPC